MEDTRLFNSSKVSNLVPSSLGAIATVHLRDMRLGKHQCEGALCPEVSIRQDGETSSKSAGWQNPPA